MTRFAAVLLLVLVIFPHFAEAQPAPVAGETFTVIYNPPKDSPLADAVALDIVYVFDFWNVRYGTRLALWWNVLRPDTARVRFARMERSGEGWKADIAVPADAALLSYIVRGNGAMDGNGQKTYTRYVLNAQGEPVMNARYFNIPFLELAREPLGVQVREAEREITSYPENFRAYHQYFKLLLEQGKGSPRTQERIAGRIADMEKEYGEDMGFLNMAAETWFYILQDPEKALEYRNRISPQNMWPQVFRIYNREQQQQQQLERMTAAESHRAELRGTALPEFNLLDTAGVKVGFPQQDGKATVLVFWASTSDRSRELLPVLAELAGELGNAPVRIAAVSLDPDMERGESWFTEQNLPFDLLFNQGSTLLMLGIDSIPITYFVDAENVIRDIVVGYDARQRGQLRSALRSILP